MKNYAVTWRYGEKHIWEFDDDINYEEFLEEVKWMYESDEHFFDEAVFNGKRIKDGFKHVVGAKRARLSQDNGGKGGLD